MLAIRRAAALAAPSLALLLAACGVARVSEAETASGACTVCHGDAARASNPAAPPRDGQGELATPAVGTHLAHLDAGVTCETCHVVPSSISAPGHADGDGRAEIVFGPAAARNGASPEYVAADRTCRNTYCHGGSRTFVEGNVSAPWDAGDLGCTGCHGTPPASHGAWATDCSACHPGTVSESDDAIVPGGSHLDGVVSGHPAGFDDPAVHGPDAIAFLAGQGWACDSCHGADLGGGEGPSCNGCHASRSTAAFPSGVSDWRANCTFCHGTPTEPYYAQGSNPLLAAPPAAVAGATDPADPSVGAHRTHLYGESISNGVTCADCHAVPTDLVHVNGTPAVVTKRPGTATTVGSFGGATCSNTYCHGNLPRNPRAGNSPSWTATSGQTGCGTCHAAQWAVAGGSTTDSHSDHQPSQCDECHDNDGRPYCSMCHQPRGYSLDPAMVNSALHVNGTVDVDTDPFVGWDASDRGCNPGCHQIGEHGKGSESW